MDLVELIEAIVPAARRRTRGRLAALALAAGACCGAPAVAGPPASGSVLVGVAHRVDAEWAIVDLRSGATRLLPRSRANPHQGGWDLWWASAPVAQTLLRVNSLGDVEFLDRDSLRPVGGFSLASLPGTRRPQFFGDVKLSPDGRYVLTYWKRDIRQEDPELVIFDRQGRIVESGSPLDYEPLPLLGAFDWLPDGRYLYLAGKRIAVRQIGNPKYLVAPLRLPPDVDVNHASVAVSPDGRHLALALAHDIVNGQRVRVGYNLLFLSALDGTGLHQVTQPSAIMLDHGISMGHTDPVWSPDGRWVAFTPRQGGAYGAAHYGNPCVDVLALPVDTGLATIDGLRDPPSLQLQAGGAPVVSCSTVQWVTP